MVFDKRSIKLLWNPTLIINRNSSTCGNCGYSADPYEKTHEHILGLTPGIGCGIEWYFSSSMYTGMQEGVEEMRPDLQWRGLD